MEMEKVFEEIRRCKKCDLYRTRKNPVPGEGNVHAKIMLIGEAPGYNEDLQGRPFVGKAGKLLDELLKIARLERSEVFITNVVKCRPPGNRKPNREEIKACSPFLKTQIRIIKPELILTLGNVATQFIFEEFSLKFETMSKLHGKIFKVSNLWLRTKVIPMYHPAAVLRNPNLRKVVEEDWKNVRKIL